MDIRKPTQNKVCSCGQQFEATGGKRICPTCSEQKDAALTARYESETLVRPRTPVEVLIGLYMEKYGPAPDAFTPRQHLALARKISSQTQKVMADNHPVWREFEFRLCVIAYRLGKLTEERWAKMRRMYPYGDKYKGQLATLYLAVMGKPVKQRFHAYENEWYLHGDDLKLELPLLRKMFDDPTYKPASTDLPDALTESLNRLLQSDERHGGRYGFLPSTRQNNSLNVDATSEEPVNPEQIDHVDQDEIDFVAAELLDSMDWGGL